jgi:transposase-like protein
LPSTFFLDVEATGYLMDDLKTFCCQNPDCADYGQRGRDNLRVCFRNGPNKERRVLACRTCQKRFSERKGTPLYRCKLAEEKALAVLQHRHESCGVRQTSRLVGVNKDTVTRLAVVAGSHASQLHDEFVAFSPSDPGSPVR